MKLASKLAAGAAALTVGLGAAQASQAAIVDWTLTNGTFDDGGTFSGTFRFDTVTDTITDWSVTTDSAPFPVTYSSPDGCSLGGLICNSASDNGSGPSFSQSQVGGIGTTFELTNIPLAAGPGFVGALTGDQTFFIVSATVTSGQATGVLVSGGAPEPGTWTLMIAGVGLAGTALRSRRRPART